ncbi:acyl carrier protein [Litorimonas taeanensis]|uniref:Acyl carrier protein n=1 Tax=Litorimonas taeanensis TaxID=568099 RepID=A0A420WMT0_9PROT|nr:acyl carrier protein [Litorimonas taeanensis]RKQ72206.1 acyl carrier protein [Litorimonas taeanensis]
MELDKFLEELTEVLELDDTLTVESPLDEENGYDSLGVLSVIALVDENFGISLSGEVLSELKSVKELISLIGEDKIT